MLGEVVFFNSVGEKALFWNPVSFTDRLGELLSFLGIEPGMISIAPGQLKLSHRLISQKKIQVNACVTSV